MSVLFLLASGEEGGDGTVWDLFVSFFITVTKYTEKHLPVCVGHGKDLFFSWFQRRVQSLVACLHVAWAEHSPSDTWWGNFFTSRWMRNRKRRGLEAQYPKVLTQVAHFPSQASPTQTVPPAGDSQHMTSLWGSNLNHNSTSLSHLQIGRS